MAMELQKGVVSPGCFIFLPLFYTQASLARRELPDSFLALCKNDTSPPSLLNSICVKACPGPSPNLAEQGASAASSTLN